MVEWFGSGVNYVVVLNLIVLVEVCEELCEDGLVVVFGCFVVGKWVDYVIRVFFVVDVFGIWMEIWGGGFE